MARMSRIRTTLSCPVSRSKRIGFVFQSFNLLPRTTAIEAHVELPMIYADRKINRSRAAEALARVGLAHREHHFATGLSGGEQQRVAIAQSAAQAIQV